MRAELPELNNKACIATDCEEGFRNAIKKYFPEMPLFRCWNHLWGNIEDRVKSKGGNKEDVAFYSDSVRAILLQPSMSQVEKQIKKSKEGYIATNGRKVEPWSVSFSGYFEKHIYKDINSLAACVITKYCAGLFNEYSGLTTNQAEGFNNLLKVK
jgi:hypothetical protein